MAIERVTIQGFRGARDVVLEPGSLCALVGESSSGKSTVLSAIWTLLEAAAPMPTGEDVSRGEKRVHVEAEVGGRTLFLDAKPPETLNLNRQGAPHALFFPADLRPTTLLAPTDSPAKRAVGVVSRERTEDGGLTLVRSLAALVEARVRGLVILIEEPELYLSPPAQRHLHRLLRALASRGRNQVLYSTHSPVFLGVDKLDELVLVRHDERTGTTLLQPEALTRKQAFRMVAELDAERAEMFLARAVMLVEGRTEKVALPFVFSALGLDADQEAITVVDCQGKGNIPLFAEICNACHIPYVVLHDRDAPRKRRDPARRRSQADDHARARLRRCLRPARAAGQAGGGVAAVPGRQRLGAGPAQASGRARGRGGTARATDDARRLTRQRVTVAAVRFSGSSIQNVEPAPGSDCTRISPPCVSTISRATARPRPVPAIRAEASELRKNFSKTRSRSASSIPMPWSLTISTARSPSSSTCTRTAPPAGEYLIAFESRFPITCASRSRSPSITTASSGSSSTS